MIALENLQKQQVGLRLPKYLIDEIDEFTKEYSLNRSEIIAESIKAFITEQKAKKLYDSFDTSCKELNNILQTDDSKLQSLDGLINELNH
ncbi:ribbon-helix-helix domain-containing protein (plasmid) [Sulfurospirillum sp. 'SP']|nr:ribbon-helix-helix domain-containing protein [Sulfurospirillum sp. 'SP']WNZ00433.1 ribbon-helix-helix domain-containing protein [Sulfurospirillum sp. 'SP']